MFDFSPIKHGEVSDSEDEALDTQVKDKDQLTLEVMRKAQIRRDALERIYIEPWMSKFIWGLYCKLSCGERNGAPVYRICEICGIITIIFCSF